MPVDVYTEAKQQLTEAKQQLTELLESLFGDDASPEDAARFVAHPSEVLAEHDLTPESLDGVDLDTLVSQAAAAADIPSQAQEALQSFRPAGGASAGAGGAGAGSVSPTQELVTHISSVTVATYEGDEHFTTLTKSFTTFDNSVDVDIDDLDGDLDIDNEQDVDVDQTEVNADDGGVAVLGDDAEVNAATGEDAQVIEGDVDGVANTGDDNANVGDDGQANTGDGAVQVGDDLEDSLVNTGTVDDGSVLANGDIEAPVNTGENDGIIAGGDVDDAVVGDDNQVANADDNEGVINFGGGADITNISDSDVDDAAISTGGDATNVSDNEDSAVSLGGDAQNISNNDVRDGVIAGDDGNNASNNDLDEGSALSAGGDAKTDVDDSFNDTDVDVDVDDSFNEDSFNDTDVDADESIVTTQEGSGELEQDDTELDD
jgi:hypothetical protein